MASIRTSQVPNTTGADAQVNIGCIFTIDTDGYECTGGRYYKLTALYDDDPAVQMGLWAGSTLIASASRSQTAGDAEGWIDLAWTPVPLSTGVTYTVALLTPGAIGYCYLAGGLTSAIDNAPLHTPATAGRYEYGATLTRPTANTTGTDFFTDVVVGISNNGYVTAVKATGTGAAPAPSVSIGPPVVAVKATGTGQAIPPEVSSAGVNGSVTAVKAVGTGQAEAPAIDLIVSVTGGGPASGTGQARVPTISDGTISVTVTAVKATGTGTAPGPGVNVVETLPSNTGTGRITARFATAEVLVGDNDGVPNIYPVTTETVTFTSTASVLLNATAEPDAIVILPQPIVCTLDSQGYLVDSAGHRWCDLIATDDADLTPSARKWNVAFSSGLGIASFPISVPAGTTIDLTAVIPT